MLHIMWGNLKHNKGITMLHWWQCSWGTAVRYYSFRYIIYFLSATKSEIILCITPVERCWNLYWGCPVVGVLMPFVFIALWVVPALLHLLCLASEN